MTEQIQVVVAELSELINGVEAEDVRVALNEKVIELQNLLTIE